MRIILKTITAALLLSAATQVYCMDTHERQASTSLSSLHSTKVLEFGEPDHTQNIQFYDVEYPTLFLNSIADNLDSDANGAFFITAPGFDCPDHQLGYAFSDNRYKIFETYRVESCFFNGQIIPGKISFKIKEKDLRFIIDFNTNKVEPICADNESKDLLKGAFNLVFSQHRRNDHQASESNKIRTDIQEQFGVPCIYLSPNKYINRDSIIGLLTGKIRTAFYDSPNKTWALHDISVTETTAVFDEMLRSRDFSNFSFAHPIRLCNPKIVAHEYTLLWNESADAYQSIGKLTISELSPTQSNRPNKHMLAPDDVDTPNDVLPESITASTAQSATREQPFTSKTKLLWNESADAYQSIGKLTISELSPTQSNRPNKHMLAPDDVDTPNDVLPESITASTAQSATREQPFTSKIKMKKELLKATIAGDMDTVFQIITSEAERLTKGDRAHVFANALNKGHIGIAAGLIQELDQDVINDEYVKAKNCQEIRDLLRPFSSARYQGY